MESNVEYKINENITHAKYENLYYINREFCYLKVDKNDNSMKKENKTILKKTKTLGGPEHTGQQDPNNFNMIPKSISFENKEKLQEFIDTLNIKNIKGNTLHFSHYYEHNISHSLYDALYPIYMAYLNFFDGQENAPVNMFLNILIDQSWRAPNNYRATRQWVLDVFKDFCYGGQFILKKTVNYNLKFNCLIVGADRAGISSTNKLGIMPGKNLYALEKLRNRFFKIYKIIKQKRDKLSILFINSTRYNQQENIILKQLMDYYKSKNYSVKYLDWKDINSFKDQLMIMNETDIQISAAGSAMLNFPFLNNNSININLGSKDYGSHNKPTLLEINICLLSNKIYTDFYDIYKYREIKYEPLKNMLDDNINNILQNKILTTKIPFYTQKWRELCVKENMADIINKMNMDGSGTQKDIASRFPDIWLVI